MPIDLLLISSNPDVAAYAVDCGVDRIFVDLEIHGKRERQGHLDTVLSGHSLADVEIVRQAVSVPLLVRINPLHAGSAAEVESALSAGADQIMLPMFHRVADVVTLIALVRGRAKIIPLVETPAAMARLPGLVELDDISEYFIGLNDLHLGLGLDFMFEILSDGLVDHMANVIKAGRRRFGFGGIARIGQGAVPGEMVLGEHVRLGSSAVILSRSFHGRAATVTDLRTNLDLKQEINRLRASEQGHHARTAMAIERDRRSAIEAIRRQAQRIAAAASQSQTQGAER